MNIVSKRLKQIRLEKGYSQKQLGIAAGIDEFSSSSRMNQYERGKHVPDILTIERIAMAIGVPPPYFYAEDDALADWIKIFPLISSEVKNKLITDYLSI